MFTRFQGYTVLKSVFSSTVSQMQSGLLCLSFSCVTLLREALVYFYALFRAFISVKQFTPFTVYSVQGYTVFKSYPLSLRYRDPAASPLNARQYMLENQAIKLINRQLSWLAGSLTCLRAFTRFYALLRAFTHFYTFLRGFSRFYALFTVTQF